MKLCHKKKKPTETDLTQFLTSATIYLWNDCMCHCVFYQ